MADTKVSCVIDWGDGTREIYTLKQLAEKVKNDDVSIEQALKMAYDNALWDLEKACIDKSRKMSTVKDHTYYCAVGTHAIHNCVERLQK